MRVASVAVALALAACRSEPPEPESADGPVAPAAPLVLAGSNPFTPEQLARILTLSPLAGPPPDPTNAYGDDPRAAHLGRFLFFDERLSGAGDVSCATCHDPAQQWTDGRRLARATPASPQLERHTMSLWNVAWNRWQFWDGRADSLWSQALGPLEDEREHAGDRTAYARLVRDDADLRRAYEGVFGPLPELSGLPAHARPAADAEDHPHAAAWEAMSERQRDDVSRVFANLGKSIAAFERRIVSRESAFDGFVRGLREADPTAQRNFGDPARRGLALFLGRANCHLCHSGPLFSDREFHDNRAPLPPGATQRLDPGRYRGIELLLASEFNGKGPYSDAKSPEARRAVSDDLDYLITTGHAWSAFKTPSLRNVALTPPYMHRGQLATLADVIEFYDTLEGAAPTHQHTERTLVPLGLTPGERADLLAFLESLTDVAIDPELTRPPPKPFPAE